MTKEERKIFEALHDEFEEKEHKCLKTIKFLDEHKFYFEYSVEEIKRTIYHECAMKLEFALDDIDELNQR